MRPATDQAQAPKGWGSAGTAAERIGERVATPAGERRPTSIALDPSARGTADDAPSGTVTFLFTDIEGSTRLLERLKAQYAEVLADQRTILRTAFAAWHGREVDTQGDSFFVAFPRAADALRCAVDAQRGLAGWRWPEDVEVRVRMGIHTGEPLVSGGGYVGIEVHRAARIGAAGHGGQILLSGTTRDLVADDLPAGTELRDLGSHRLKDLRGETRIFELAIAGLSTDFPPLLTAAAEEPPPTPGEAPYRGLQAFEEEDAALFFGREETVSRLVDQVSRARFVALVGASGSGKSSILRAGLVANLRAALPPWRIHLLTPTAHPLEALAGAIAPDARPAEVTALADDFLHDPRSLAVALPRAQGATRGRRPTGGGRSVRTIIAVDQLEEVFTLCRDEEERAAFLSSLIHACGLDDGPAGSRPDADRATVVITLRADFYAFLAPYPALRDGVAASQLYVGTMSAAELRQAIEEPARRRGWEFVPGLVELLLRDVGDEPGALPLLSHALLETWQRRRGTSMTLRGYGESGGVKGAIAKTADRVYAGELTEEQRPIARAIFVRLTELGDGTQDTRRRARLAELLPADPAEAASVRALIGALADARLVTVGEDGVEVAHEALIREWPTLRDWLSADRDGLRLHRRLTEAADEWELSALDEGLLYRGGRLIQARDWAAANPTVLNDTERRFLDASVARAEREAAEREVQQQRELEAAQAVAAAEAARAEEAARAAAGLRRRAFLLAGALGVAAILAVVALAFGQQAGQSAMLADQRAKEASDSATLADQRAKEARDASDLAAQRLKIADSVRLGAQAEALTVGGSGKGGELAALLALTGLHQVPTPEADAALQRAARLYFGEQVYRRTDFEDPYDAVATPDGATLIATSGDLIAFWDVASGQVSALARARGWEGSPWEDKPIGISMDRAGTVLLASSGEVFRLPDRARLDGECDFIGSAKAASNPSSRVLSWDGRMMATALRDGGIIIGPVATCGVGQARIDALVNGIGPIGTHPSRSMAFSPDGLLLAAITGTDGERISMWSVATGKAIRSLDCTSAGCETVEFSPDGRRILASAGDDTARILDARSGALVTVLRGHVQPIGDARFLPDGHRVITGSDDDTARIWNADDGRVLEVFAGHTDHIIGVAVSGDGASAFTMSLDHTIRRWRTDGPIQPAVFTAGNGDVRGLAFSADGKVIASGSSDRVQIHDVASGTSLLDMPVRDAQSLAFPSDGRQLAVGTPFGSWLVDVASKRQTQQLGPPGDGLPWVPTVAYAADGKALLASEGDGSLGLWDPSTGALTRKFSEVGGISALSPDGSLVAYTSALLCGQVVVADARTGTSQSYLNMTTGGGSGTGGLCALDLAFTPDGKQLVTADTGHGPRLWDVASFSVVREFSQPGLASVVRVSADGRYVLSNSADGFARLFELSSGKLLRAFPRHGGQMVAGLAFSADGSQIAIGGDDGSVVITPLAVEALEAQVCGQLLRDLTAQERSDYGIEGTAPTCP